MKKHKIENVELLKLIDYFKIQPQGVELTYNQIEQETGVAMDTNGKSLMRRAIKESERVYKVNHALGIWLDCLENATEIVTIQTTRVRRSIEKTVQTIKVVKPRYYHLMPKQEQELMNLRESFTNAALIEDKKSSLSTNKTKIITQNTEKIDIPKM